MTHSFFLVLPLFAISLVAAGNDRVELDLKDQQVVMSEEASTLMRSASGAPDKPLQPVELRWTNGSAVLPDGTTTPISLDIRFVPEASMTLKPDNQVAFLADVSGRLTVKSKGTPTEWQIRQDNYGIFYAKTHWFYDKEANLWRFGVHLPLAFLRESDGHQVVGHMFVAFSTSDNELNLVNAWIIPRLGGNPAGVPDKPRSLFTAATAPAQSLASTH